MSYKDIGRRFRRVLSLSVPLLTVPASSPPPLPTMRTRSVHVLLAAWLATQHAHLRVHAVPNALAAPNPNPEPFGAARIPLYARQVDVDDDAHDELEPHQHEHEHEHEHDDEGVDMDMDMSHSETAAPSLFAGHDHHVHGAPLIELNETLISMFHKPTPPSYGTYDIDGDRPDGTRVHPGLMVFHALCMSLAFFVALPIGTCF